MVNGTMRTLFIKIVIHFKLIQFNSLQILSVSLQVSQNMFKFYIHIHTQRYSVVSTNIQGYSVVSTNTQRYSVVSTNTQGYSVVSTNIQGYSVVC